MNKDYKLMAGLIPVILVLSLALYGFNDASGLKTNIVSPLLNQTDNSSLNQSSTNSSTAETQINPLNNQNSQGTSVNDYTINPPTNTNDTSSNIDNSTTDPTDQNNNPNEPTNTTL